jgi:hypothetical protein
LGGGRGRDVLAISHAGKCEGGEYSLAGRQKRSGGDDAAHDTA